jgi:Spy/CpxP family protein refolding chaperone
MTREKRFVPIAVMFICMIATGVTAVFGQRQGRPGPLEFLTRALNEAGAPALSAEQQTKLTGLFESLRSAAPIEPDPTLATARAAYDAAVLAGDLKAAEAQAPILSARMAELNTSRMKARAKIQIEALSILKSGGQLDALLAKFGEERVLGVLGPLSGPPFGRGPGPGGPR